MNIIEKTFSANRVFMPVIHFQNEKEFWRSVDIAVANSDGIWLINQKATIKFLCDAAEKIREKYTGIWIGANFLGDNKRAFSRVESMGSLFNGLWTDNAGISELDDLQLESDMFCERLNNSNWDGIYFGGTAFKYQGKVHDLDMVTRHAAEFMHVVTTSGPGTGRQAELGKIKSMRKALNQALPTRCDCDSQITKGSLALASGVSIQNIKRYLPYVNAYLVGTSIEDEFGILNEQKTKALYEVIKKAQSMRDKDLV